MKRTIAFRHGFLALAASLAPILIFQPASSAASIDLNPVALDVSAWNLEINTDPSGQWTELDLSGATPTVQIGEPAVPSLRVAVKLPDGADAAGVRLEIIDQQTVRLPLPVLPYAGEQAMNRAEQPTAAPDARVYATDAVFPAQAVLLVTTTERSSGLRHAIVQVNPVRYHALSKELVWIREARVVVDLRPHEDAQTELTRKRPALFALRAADDAAAGGSGVLFLENGFAPAQMPSLSGSPVEYVIVSPPDENMVAEWQRLADWKTDCGHPALVVTTDWIDENYPSGCDMQERIRLFARDAYVNWGLRWMLIGADPDLIPVRYVRSWAYDITAWRDVPSEYYFANLDGTWDDDRDGKFGEPNLGMAEGGPESDGVDFTAQIQVGRVSAESATDVSNWLEKYFTYVKTPATDGYLDRDLYLGEVVFDAEWTRFGRNGSPDCTMEECDGPNCRKTSSGGTICARTDGASFCFRVEEAIQTRTECEQQAIFLLERPEYWAEHEPVHSSELLTSESAVSYINSGYHLVHHVGHADRDRWAVGGTRSNVNDRLLTGDLARLNNGARDAYFLAFGLNCSSAAIDYASFAEAMLLMPGGGCVNYIGVTDADYPPISDPISQDYYAFLFAEQGGTVGDGFYPSIEENAPIGDALHQESTKRFLALTHVLLGDPGMPVWWATPQQATVTFTNPVILGTNPLAITVRAGQSPVSRALVCVQKADEVYAAVYTGNDGVAQVPFSPRTAGDFDITVTASSILPWTGTGRVAPATGGAVLVMSELQVIDDGTHNSEGNGNAAVETGELVRLSMSVRNRGQQTAPDVMTRLEVAEGAPAGLVTVIDGLGAIGPLAADAEGNDPDAFLIQIAPDFPQLGAEMGSLLRVPFVVYMDTGSKTEYTTELMLEVARPLLSVSPNVTVGGPNPRTLWLGVRNDGRGTASQLVATLVAKNSYVAITGQESVQLHDLAPGDTLLAGPFELQVTNEAMARLDFSVTSMLPNPPIELHRRDVDLRPPVAPQGLAVIGLPEAADLSWLEATDPDGDDIAGYYIYRARGEEEEFVPALDAILTGHHYVRDSGLDRLTQYRYKIRAMDVSGNVGWESLVSSAFTSPGMVDGWPNRMHSGNRCSPLVCELDRRWTNRREILLGGDVLYAYHADGSEVVDGDNVGSSYGPFSAIGSDVRAKAAVGDVDGDGQNEVLFVSFASKELLCFPYWGGTPKWRVTLPCPNAWFTPTLADFDRNDGGLLEVILCAGPNGDAGIYVYNHDGSPMVEGSNGLLLDLDGENLYHSPAVGDVDGDGALEVVMSTRAPNRVEKGAIWVVNSDGTSVPGFENGRSFQALGGPGALGQHTTGSPALCDLDHDGRDEILVVTPARIWCVDDDAQLLWSSPFTEEFSLRERELLPEPALGDVDGDGEVETAVVENGEKLYVWRAAGGTLLPNFPIDLKNVPGLAYGSCIIANVDEDGLPDIIFGDDDKRIHAYRGDGTIPRGFPIYFAGTMVKQSLAAWDIDCDNKQDLIVQAEDALSAAAYDLEDAPFDSLQPWRSNPWPMRYRDDRNTGRFVSASPVGVQLTLAEPEVDREGWVTLRWLCGERVSAFNVQRMTRGVGEWELIGAVPGLAAEGPQNYVYKDHPAGPGTFVYRVDPVRMDGNIETGPTVEVSLAVYSARRLAFQRILPDPLCQGRIASITFTVPGNEASAVPADLQVLDVQGRRVRTLVDDTRPSGSHTTYWDGRDEAGHLLPTGLYVLRLHSRGLVATARMLVVR